MTPLEFIGWQVLVLVYFWEVMTCIPIFNGCMETTILYWRERVFLAGVVNCRLLFVWMNCLHTHYRMDDYGPILHNRTRGLGEY